MQRNNTIDLAAFATALDALVGKVVHRHDVARHFEVGGGERGLVLHRGDAGFEGFDFVDVVAVLVALVLGVSGGELGGGREQGVP